MTKQERERLVRLLGELIAVAQSGLTCWDQEFSSPATDEEKAILAEARVWLQEVDPSGDLHRKFDLDDCRTGE